MLCLLVICHIGICEADQHPCVSPYQGQDFSNEQLAELLATENAISPLSERDSQLNLCGIRLKGADLRGLSLTNINLNFADLSDTNLSGIDLSKASLSFSLLNNANLTKTFLRWANLQHADLSGSILTQAQLSDADLQHATLDRADLNEAILQNVNAKQLSAIAANFSEAILTDSDFSHSQLHSAILSYANAEKSNFFKANLIDATLINTNLSQAKLNFAELQQADLSHAVLIQTHLKKTNFTQANLREAFFQPKFGLLPDIMSLATTTHFKTIHFYDPKLGAPALIELRTAYKNSGMRPMEQQITAMLQSHKMQQAWQRGGSGTIESILKYVFFYLTCEFGLNPNRPLLLFGLLVLIFTLPYRYALSFNSQASGVWIKRPNAALESIPAQASQMKLFFVSLYFSLLSAFQIGWEDFNI